MDVTDLEALLDEIRNGRSEDTATEWKRQWWDLRNPKASAEFLKDVAAMANATTKDERVILIGIDVRGNLQDAPLPEDEAGLQQRLQAIEPIPNVAFGTLQLAGFTISKIQIQEPFDRPYVARCENKNMVFVRQGSTINTATRAMLDRWYLESRKSAELRLLVKNREISGDDAVIAFPRPLHVPEPEDPGQRWLQSISMTTDPRKVADHRNREIWLRLKLENISKEAASHVVVDLEFSPVEELRLWYDSIIPVPGRPWQTDPSRNCHVASWGDHHGTGRVRQRVTRINPDTTEDLVPVVLWVMNDEVNQLRPVMVSFRITDQQGERLAGRFHIKVVFDGTKEIVKPTPRTF